MSVADGDEPTPVPQPVLAPLTRAAIFLVACVKPDRDSYAAVRSLCIDKLLGTPRPAELHPFREIRSGERHAVSTPADVLFHIRAKGMAMCFELVTQIMERIGGAVAAVDETHGFRYFDDRDLLGFVDGTENPPGDAALSDAAWAQIEEETTRILKRYLAGRRVIEAVRFHHGVRLIRRRIEGK